MKKQQKKQQNIAVKIIHLIEAIIDHRLFKPISVSIITSFVLFNSFSYLKNYLEDRKILTIDSEKRIKVNIPDNYYGFNLNQSRVANHQIKSGETLLKILLDLGVDELDVFSILGEIRKIYDPRLINVGDQFTIKYQVDLSYPQTNKDQENIQEEKSPKTLLSYPYST